MSDDFDDFDDWTETAEWDDAEQWGGGGGVAPRQVDPQREPRPRVSAWELGTGVAVAGWLLDRLPLWVLSDERDGGFVAAWLLPVFADTGPPGRAYCYVDAADRAVHAVEWGLDRHALRLGDFRWQGP